MKIFKTPGIDEIFDLYVAYGYVESLIRSGASEVELVPAGGTYEVHGDADFREGLIDALREMLSMHIALARYSPKEGGKLISDVDFSAGANVNPSSWDSIPNHLQKIQERIKLNKPLKGIGGNRGITIPLALMPSAGKFLLKHFGVEGQNPVRAKTEEEILAYALAWVGFHHYTPYIRYNKGNTTWVHIYQIAPVEPIETFELLALKDLKKHLPHYYEERMGFLANRRLALLYHLLHTESLGALEVLTSKEFVIRSYTLEKAGNNQAIRSFGEENIGKLMDFLWKLKAKSTYHTVRFLDSLLRKDSDAALTLVDAVLNDRPEGLYMALRVARRSGVVSSRSVIEGMEAFIDET
ncbi:type I-A CRISPR-associated protein Cas8a2/Csa4 [Pyrococcus kukulkanii]|uniref:CRISPR-associated protein Cas4 n=1 Tax=Pyrococcus kukulkanii TaxID=1609559 RepID=A0A127B8U2_9EURY|nr:type I-A CRISPR-associated protein Cas8a2/Csa4 [Pyrococcus kukulkanii]AMM53708.1 CRISPR-associated protein Cas4 [Pyrococcus kukulkanii]